MGAGDGRGPAAAISAHQGGREGASRGTYLAYQQALRAGAEYVEFDVRRTEDGKLVAYHGTRAARPGAGMSYTRLCELAGYQVPLAADLMRLLAGKAAGHVDLKEPRWADVIVGQAVEILGTPGFVVTTGDAAAAAAIRRRFPGVQVALTIGGDAREEARFRWRRARSRGHSRLDRVLACQADWAAVHHRIAGRGLLEECRRNGIRTMVWTVNGDRALARWLTHPCVDVVVTDRPARAAALRAGAGRGCAR